MAAGLVRWLARGALLLAAALSAGCASIQGLLPGASTASAADTAPARPPSRPEFTLIVEAPTALRDLLLRHLDLARLQQLPDDERLGNAEFNRLVAAVPAQARELLQTEGYFDAQVTVQREDERVPDGRRTAVPGTVRVQVQPGAPTRVTALDLQPEGELQRRIAAGEADALALQQALPAGGVLGPGQVFRNADWTATKQQLVTPAAQRRLCRRQPAAQRCAHRPRRPQRAPQRGARQRPAVPGRAGAGQRPAAP